MQSDRLRRSTRKSWLYFYVSQLLPFSVLLRADAFSTSSCPSRRIIEPSSPHVLFGRAPRFIDDSVSTKEQRSSRISEPVSDDTGPWLAVQSHSNGFLGLSEEVFGLLVLATVRVTSMESIMCSIVEQPASPLPFVLARCPLYGGLMFQWFAYCMKSIPRSPVLSFLPPTLPLLPSLLFLYSPFRVKSRFLTRTRSHFLPSWPVPNWAFTSFWATPCKSLGSRRFHPIEQDSWFNVCKIAWWNVCRLLLQISSCVLS